MFFTLVFSQEQKLETVQSVDLKKFAGKWYEIARLRVPWEFACALNTTYTYTLKTDEDLQVVSQCQTNDGLHRLEKAEGTAQLIDKHTHAKFKLSFPRYATYKWTYNGDYWIIQLAEDYSYAVMSEPTQKHVWILSRTPTLPPDTYQTILDKISLQLPAVNVLDIMLTEQKDTTPQLSK